MLKNKLWIGIILSILLLVFSIPGFTAYYKYTQESGTNFYVGTDDKSDALEDTNEIRQILDDLGNLLGHSKRDDLYPKNGTTGGYLGRLNYGLDASKPAVPVINDLYLATDTVKIYRCFVAENWVQVYPGTIENNVIKTGDFIAGRIAKINNATGIIEMATNTDAQVSDAVTKAHAKNADTFLVFTNALSSDHTYSGEVDSQPVGENVVFGDLLYKDWAAGEWKKAKADAYATARATRIALESKADGQTCLMLVKGYIRDDSAFDFGAVPIFLNDDTAGTCDDTAPAESGDQIFMVGEAKSADILFFNPGQDVGEI